MEEIETLIEQGEGVAARLLDVRVEALSDASLVSLVARAESLGRLVDTLRVRAAAEVDDRSRYELGSDGLSRRYGHTRASHLLEQLTRTSAAVVAARLSLGRFIRPRQTLDGAPIEPLYPLVAQSLPLIGMESARVIARTLEQAAPACSPLQLANAEAHLVSQATEQSTDLVAVQARMWRDALDPDGAEPRDEVIRQRRALRIGREVDGMARVTLDMGGCDLAEFKSTLDAYASPRIMPRFRSDDDLDPDDPFRETRTRHQVQLDTLLGLVRAGSRSDDTRPGPRAAIRVTVRAEDITAGRGVAWLDGVQAPVSLTTLAELSCGGEHRTAVHTAEGAILTLGRTARLFSEAQVVALAVRDGGCIWNGCTAPPSWCDAHHVVPWSESGDTDVCNGVLLCPAHHRELHASDFELRMVDGVPYLRAPARLDATRHWHRASGSHALAMAGVAGAARERPG
jgi:hypothetical protein